MKLTKLKALIPVFLVCVVFVVVQTSNVSAFSVMELLGLDKTEDEEVKSGNEQQAGKKADDKSKQQWSKTSAEAASQNPQIDLGYVNLLVANMSAEERTKVLDDAVLFKQVVESEAKNRSVVSAAIANKLHNDKNIAFLMRRGAENILRESYLNRLVLSKLPKDFPSKEQVAEYYENNKSQFVLPERVHVWQIFYSKPEDEKEFENLKKKVEGLIRDLKKGKADFSNIALAESEHEQSKNLGGYMGVLKTSELLPEIKESILKLKEGEISQLVESESGIHILKRGKILEPQTVELSKVESQIRKVLINQANTQLRSAIYTQASKEFPQDMSDKKLEEWRLRLKTNTTP